MDGIGLGFAVSAGLLFSAFTFVLGMAFGVKRNDEDWRRRTQMAERYRRGHEQEVS